MELQLRCISLQSSHLNHTCFLQEVQSEHVVSDVLCVLDHACDRMHDVDQIVTLIVNFVNFGATLRELTCKCKLDHILDYFWVRLVAHFEDIFLVDFLVEA